LLILYYYHKRTRDIGDTRVSGDKKNTGVSGDTRNAGISKDTRNTLVSGDTSIQEYRSTGSRSLYYNMSMRKSS